MTLLNITLSRAHKIAERLKTMAQEEQAQAVKHLTAQSLTAAQIQILMSQADHVARTTQRVTDGLASLERFRQLTEHWQSVRTLIATTNEQRGITALLTQQESVQRQIQAFESVVASLPEESTCIHPSSLKSLTLPSGDDARWTTFSVSAMTPDEQTRLQTTLKQLKGQHIALTDRVAELNAQRVSFELPDEVAHAVQGL